MSKYDYAPRRTIRTPVQYGGLSRRREDVAYLGVVITESKKEKGYYRYYRRNSGRFVAHHVVTNERGLFNYLIHIPYGDLPREIKDAIKKQEF